MEWFGISGSWRKTNQEIDEKVRNVIHEIMARGNGIVSGGALGVDFIALDEAFKIDPKAERIKIFLPTTFEVYTAHYRKHALLGTITGAQAESLISQLTELKKINSKAVIENPDTNFTESLSEKRAKYGIYPLGFHFKQPRIT